MCARSAVGSAARLPSFVMVTGMTNRSEHLAEADDRWRQGVVVRGARQNNLADVDLDVPRDRLVVFTGVSGSGKSSLAFGTLFAESQRRYLESVAPYARRLIDQVGVPDVDVVEGLPPAVALQQHRGIGNARSNVASVTTLGSLVRMLYSRAGLTQMTNRCSTRRTSRRTPCRAHVRPAMASGASTRSMSTRWSPIPHSASGSARSLRGRRAGRVATFATSWCHWDTTSTLRGRSCRRNIATGSCSPRTAPPFLCTRDLPRHRLGERSKPEPNPVTRAISSAPGGSCSIPSRTPRARSSRSGSLSSSPARYA